MCRAANSNSLNLIILAIGSTASWGIANIKRWQQPASIIGDSAILGFVNSLNLEIGE